MMNELQQTSTIFGGNMPYIEEQYENYLADPASVEPKWRAYFDAMRAGASDVAHQPVIDAFAAMAKSRSFGKGMRLESKMEMATPLPRRLEAWSSLTPGVSPATQVSTAKAKWGSMTLALVLAPRRPTSS